MSATTIVADPVADDPPPPWSGMSAGEIAGSMVSGNPAFQPLRDTMTAVFTQSDISPAVRVQAFGLAGDVPNEPIEAKLERASVIAVWIVRGVVQPAQQQAPA